MHVPARVPKCVVHPSSTHATAYHVGVARDAPKVAQGGVLEERRVGRERAALPSGRANEVRVSPVLAQSIATGGFGTDRAEGGHAGEVVGELAVRLRQAAGLRRILRAERRPPARLLGARPRPASGPLDRGAETGEGTGQGRQGEASQLARQEQGRGQGIQQAPRCSLARASWLGRNRGGDRGFNRHLVVLSLLSRLATCFVQ